MDCAHSWASTADSICWVRSRSTRVATVGTSDIEIGPGMHESLEDSGRPESGAVGVVLTSAPAVHNFWLDMGNLLCFSNRCKVVIATQVPNQKTPARAGRALTENLQKIAFFLRNRGPVSTRKQDHGEWARRSLPSRSNVPAKLAGRPRDPRSPGVCAARGAVRAGDNGPSGDGKIRKVRPWREGQSSGAAVWLKPCRGGGPWGPSAPSTSIPGAHPSRCPGRRHRRRSIRQGST